VGIFDALGLLFLPFRNLIQKFKNFVCGDVFNPPFSEVLVKPGEERLIRLNRIFFVNSTCGTPAIVFPLL